MSSFPLSQVIGITLGETPIGGHENNLNITKRLASTQTNNTQLNAPGKGVMSQDLRRSTAGPRTPTSLSDIGDANPFPNVLDVCKHESAILCVQFETCNVVASKLKNHKAWPGEIERHVLLQRTLNMPHLNDNSILLIRMDIECPHRIE